MKTAIVAILLTVLVSIGTTAQSHRYITDIPSFTKITLANGIHMVLVKSDRRCVRADGERTVISKVVCQVVEGHMSIYAMPFKYKNSKRITVYVEYDSTIVSINCKASNRVRAEEPIEGGELQITARNGCDFFINMDVDHVRATVTSGSNIQFVGRSGSTDIHVENGSTVHAYNLESQIVHLTATLASKVEITATAIINIDASSDSEVRYKGDPPERSINALTGSRVFAQ